MKNSTFVMMAFCGLLSAACVDDSDLSVKNDTSGIESSFNYQTIGVVTLNLSYQNLPQGYKPLFCVYDRNPFTNISGQAELDTDIEPVAKGFIEADGTYNHAIQISTAVSKVYIYSSYVGVPTLLVADVVDGMITANEENEVDILELAPRLETKASKAVVNYLSYTQWDRNGRIDSRYRTTVDAMDAQMLEMINRSIPEAGDNASYAMSTDFYISEAANVTIRYVYGATAARSTMGYYCYKGNHAPDDVSQLNKVVIFPNAHKNSKGVYADDAVQLKFYDETTGTFSDVFPSGYTLGWFIVNDGAANISRGYLTDGYGTFYSTDKFNSDGRTHTAAFDMKYNDQTLRVLSIEDWTDTDYNDVIFSVHSNPVTALGPVPVVEPSQEETVVSTSYKGILAFEDLWPSKGDFDLNDAVIKYESQVYIGQNDNKVIRTEDSFVILWAGAALQSSFGYELNTPAANVTTEFEAFSYTFEGQGLDPECRKAVIMVADELKHNLKGNSTTTSFRIRNTFAERVSSEELGAAPYNPFLVINGCMQSDRKEVHLVDKAPTSKADISLFGTKDDYSDIASGFYYRTNVNYPFAIQMPNVTELGSFLGSSNEGTPISKTFPKYNSWVNSKGADDADWYNYPLAQ